MSNLEKEIEDKGLTAPRITQEHVESVVANTEFYVFPNSQLTVCCLTLVNGFNVTGESACVSPENFDKELGEKIALGKAMEKVWMPEAYMLKQRLFEKAKEA